MNEYKIKPLRKGHKTKKIMGLLDLFKPEWESKNEEEALSVIKRLAYQKKLAKLAKAAKTASNGNVRKAAVEKLTDIAENDTDWKVRKAAYKRLGNKQAALGEVAKNYKNSNVRIAAVNNLTDQAVLAGIAKNDESKYVREAAFRRLDAETKRSVLAEIANINVEGYLAEIANINVEGYKIETDLTCKRCGQRCLSRKKFISELDKLGLRINPQTNSITASGAFSGYSELGKLQRLSMKLEDVSALKCTTCGNIYCLSCLVNYASQHRTTGGKACFVCGGSINYA